MTSSGEAIRRTPRVATIDHRWTAPLGQKLNDQRILKQCCCRFREMGSKTTLKAWYVKRLPTVLHFHSNQFTGSRAMESTKLSKFGCCVASLLYGVEIHRLKDFFSCVCLLASMARSVNCHGQKKNCTGPFNWGEAHCAGEIVKRRAGPFQRKSLTNQTRTTTQQKGAARHGNQEPPGQAPRCTGRKNKTNHKKPETSKTNLGTP